MFWYLFINSIGAHRGSLLKSLMTSRWLTCFIPRANTGNCVSQTLTQIKENLEKMKVNGPGM